MSVDIKVISVDEKFGKDILKLKGYILYIFQLFRFLRLWLYPITTIRPDQLDFSFCGPARMVFFFQIEIKISQKKNTIKSVLEAKI